MFHVWKFFIDLNNARGSNGFGMNALSYTETKAYFDLHEILPLPYELDAIRILDRLLLEQMQKEQKAKSKSKK
jgi:hypothetical protein